ncbi:hypothetical protein L1285_17495 [Pseudoalteromonas sp. DL2-H2.2]|uniref:hypothetical protein n=1 Tax=Pseudoalteromonas sp. DL2-H2.2 TaxID=2908889 RepID=UPI001F2958BB|nr:hypothetical protein [Pseudoalteromonas sp. DL2-H2.2]MCF2910112.1 hypothetical protein [Pseudoalteromonas sp. DL2-H2.2]
MKQQGSVDHLRSPAGAENKVKYRLPHSGSTAKRLAKLGDALKELKAHSHASTQSVNQLLNAMSQLNAMALLDPNEANLQAQLRQFFKPAAKEQAADAGATPDTLEAEHSEVFEHSDQLVQAIDKLTSAITSLELSPAVVVNSAQQAASVPQPMATAAQFVAPQLSAPQQATHLEVNGAAAAPSASVAGPLSTQQNTVSVAPATGISTELGQLTTLAPQLGEASGLPTVVAQFKATLPALQQLDLGGMLAGDLQAIQAALPVLLDVADIPGLQKTLAAELPAMAQLDLAGVLQGDLQSLLEVTPGVLTELGLDGASGAVTRALPALKQLDMAGIVSGDLSSLLDQAPQVFSALDMPGAARSMANILPALQKIDAQGVLSGDLTSLVETAPELFNAFGMNEVATLFEQHSGLIQKLDVKGLMNGDLSSLSEVVPEVFEALNMPGAAQAMQKAMPVFAKLDPAALVEGDLSSLLHATPEVMRAFELDEVADKFQAAIPGLTKLDMKGIAQGDLSSLMSAAPELADALQLGDAGQLIGAALPVLQKFDVDGLLAGDLSSLIEAGPELLHELGMGDAANLLQQHAGVVQKLDVKGLMNGDLTSLGAAAPELFNALNMPGAAQVMEKAMPVLGKLDASAMMKGDLSSLLDVAPELFEVLELGDVGAVMQSALPALQKFDLDGLMSGDLSSLAQAGPELLNAFGMKDAASLLQQHSGIFEQLNIKGVMDGDLSSLVDIAPDVFSALGMDDAASFMEQHEAVFKQLDVPGLLQGDLSSLGDAASQWLSDSGLFGDSSEEGGQAGDAQGEPDQSDVASDSEYADSEDAAYEEFDEYDLLDEAEQDDEQKDQDKKKKDKKNKKKPGKGRNKGKKGKGKGAKGKGKGAKGKGNTRKDVSARPGKTRAKPGKSHPKPKPKPKPKQSKLGNVMRQLDKGSQSPQKMTANSPKNAKLGQFAGKKGGFLSRLPGAKLFGKMAAPLSAVMGAVDVATTLSDDTLTAQQKTQQLGTAVGGAGGAWAGAAAGAALGSVIPGIGTAVGGLIGGALGAMGGESVGGWLGDKLGGWFEDDPDPELSTDMVSEEVEEAAIATSELHPEPVTPEQSDIKPGDLANQASSNVLLQGLAGPLGPVMSLTSTLFGDSKVANEPASAEAELPNEAPGGLLNEVGSNALLQGLAGPLGPVMSLTSKLFGEGKSTTEPASTEAKLAGKTPGGSLSEIGSNALLQGLAGPLGPVMSLTSKLFGEGKSTTEPASTEAKLAGKTPGGSLSDIGSNVLLQGLAGPLGPVMSLTSKLFGEGKSTTEPAATETELAGKTPGGSLNEIGSNTLLKGLTGPFGSIMSLFAQPQGNQKTDKARVPLGTSGKSVKSRMSGTVAKALNSPGIGMSSQFGPLFNESADAAQASEASLFEPGTRASKNGQQPARPGFKLPVAANDSAFLAQQSQLKTPVDGVLGALGITAGPLGAALQLAQGGQSQAASAGAAQSGPGGSLVSKVLGMALGPVGGAATSLLGGWFNQGAGQEGAEGLHSLVLPDSPATNSDGASSVFTQAEGFIKNQFINPFNLVAGTASAYAGLKGQQHNPVHKVAKIGNLAGDALNYHTVWQAANDDALSGSQKSGVIGGTLGGMFSAKAVSGLMENSRNPWLKMAAPLAGFATNALVGSQVSSWFGDEPKANAKGNVTAQTALPFDPDALWHLSDSDATSSTPESSHFASDNRTAQVTVNANITVNARSGEQAQDIAIQVKQLLEQQQQQAILDLNAGYFNHVA